MVIRPPTLDRPKAEFSSFAQGDGLVTPRSFVSMIGTLLLRNRLLVDPVTLGQNPQALFTILYCSTDCLCRGGAPVKNLTHSASFHSKEKIAPSKPRIKHLGSRRNRQLCHKIQHGFPHHRLELSPVMVVVLKR